MKFNTTRIRSALNQNKHESWNKKQKFSVHQVILIVLGVSFFQRLLPLSIPRIAVPPQPLQTSTNGECTRNRNHEELRKCWDNNYNDVDDDDDDEIIRHPPCAGLMTLTEILDRAELPCDYVHDGLYLKESNVVLEEVYKTLTELFDREPHPSRIVPVFAEIGGHDGITKSISLKSSRCLRTNTILIEASPLNYKVLRKSRAYDTTVNAALCDGDFANIFDNPVNSGETKITTTEDTATATTQKTARVPCTTLDDEIDAMRSTLPGGGNDYQMKLVFLVLDVEGHEETAVGGIQKYSPMKAMVETKYGNEGKIEEWANGHGLLGNRCRDNTCFNYKPQKVEYPPNVFYGARKRVPKDTYKTSEVVPAYMHYGE